MLDSVVFEAVELVEIGILVDSVEFVGVGLVVSVDVETEVS